MSFQCRVIKKEDLNKVLQALSEDYKVYVPYREDSYVAFDTHGSDNMDLDFGNSRTPPLKNLLFPENEELYSYKRTEKGYEVTQASLDNTKKIVFGARCCDCAGVTRLDEKFYQEPPDPYYDSRRQNTTVVALACNEPPSYACFCTSVGVSPYGEEGNDILMTDLGERFLAQAVTENGSTLLKKIEKYTEEASENDITLAKELHERVDISLRGLRISWEGLVSKTWEEESKRCISCGICAFLCPSCSCFTIETIGSPRMGRVVRMWDTCQFPAYSLEASGHNPRPNKDERLRQRVLDKFCYSQQKHEKYDCVGCGRCIERCPANIDVREMLSTEAI